MLYPTKLYLFVYFFGLIVQPKNYGLRDVKKLYFLEATCMKFDHSQWINHHRWADRLRLIAFASWVAGGVLPPGAVPTARVPAQL